MSLERQVLVIILMFLLSFVYLRCFLYGIKRYQLNNSAYKKKKKGESFKEWLFYSRYKEEIPKFLRVFHHLVLIIHLVGIIVCLLARVIQLPFNIGEAIAIYICCFDVIWAATIALLFWSASPGFAYERWITKKRGQPPKKK